MDSGADRTVVPRVLVEALGVSHDRLPILRDEKGDQIEGHGVGGGFEIRVCRGRVRWRARTVCKEFWVADTTWVLLGRADFFRLFDVCFAWSNSPPYMDIEPVGTRWGSAAGPRPIG